MGIGRKTVIITLACLVILCACLWTNGQAQAQTLISDGNPIRMVLTTNGGVTLEATGQERYVQIWNRSSNTFTRINVPDTNLQSMDTDNTNIAFIAYRGGGSIVYLYNMTTKQLTQLDVAESNKRNIKIAGNNLVWEDYSSGEPVIVLYSLASKGSKIIGASDAQQYSPVISAKYVAWLARNNMRDAICIYDLATGTKTQVQNTVNAKLSLAINNDRLVWAETREVGDTAPTATSSDRYFDWVWGNQAGQSISNIWMYDITKKTTTRLTNSQSNQVQPYIWGNQVAWVDTGSGNPDVQVMDLGTKKVTVISATDIFEVQPVLGNGYISWIDLKGNLGDLQVQKLAGAAAVPAPVTSQAIKVTINGTNYNMDPLPYLKSGRVMVPMRKIFELLGASVSWNNTEKSVTAVKAERNIKLYIGKTTASVNGKSTVLDAAPELKNSSTMIPLRFVGEALGYTVNWDDKTRTVTIKK